MGFELFNEVMEKYGDRITFKEFTQENDIVLIVTEEHMMWGYVKKIQEEDLKGMRDVSITILSLPPLDLDIHVNNKQLDGMERFLIKETEAILKPMNFYNDVTFDVINKLKDKSNKSLVVKGNSTHN